jgi:Tol biopolymer transport system component
LIYDRNGTQIGVIGKRAGYYDVRFSPDGKKVAYSVVDSVERSIDVFYKDLSSAGEPTRFAAYSNGTERFPVWSHDGTEIAFVSDKPLSKDFPDSTWNYEIYRKSLKIGAKEEMIPTTQDFVKQTFDWTPDGKYIAFVTSASTSDPAHQSDILLLATKGKEGIVPFLKEKDNEWDPRISYDGKCIAWCSNQISQQNEVFVSRFPGPPSGERVSYEGGGERAGGTAPRWANGSKELFYLTLDNKLMVVQIKLSGTGIQIVERKALFQTYATTNSDCYDVSPDGTKIIVNTVDEQGGPLVFVSNWTEALNKK